MQINQTRETQLEFLYEMSSDDVHRVLKTVADRSIVGLPKQPSFGLRDLQGSSCITTEPPKEPYFPIIFVWTLPEELLDKLNLLVQEKKNRKPDDLKMDQIFFWM